jgi:hypothetical protein
MSDLTTGWRKRQIALNKKAENARELGLDYEPSKTVMEMARSCGINFHQAGWPELERLVELVRADEREACAKIVEVEAMQYAEPVWAFEIVNDIRARGQA